MKMQTQITLSLLSLAIITAFFGCDTRKDIVPGLEQSASVAPTITVRRMNSGLAFVSNFKDTTIIGTSGYRLQYQISGNASLSTLSFQCATGCSNVTYTLVKPDSGLILIYVNNGTSASFTLSVSNKFGQTATANFSLATVDPTPTLFINNNNLLLPFVQKLTDSVKTVVSAIYPVGYQMTGYNVTSSNIVVKRLTAGDANPFTVGTTINFNFSAVVVPKTYQYKIYVVDPLGKTSDTCLLNLYVYKDIPPVYDGLSGETNPVTNELCTDAYLGTYLGGAGPTWWAYYATVTINAHYPSTEFGGYIAKIKWQIEYKNWSNAQLFNQTYITTYTTANTSYTLNWDTPYYENYFSWPGQPTNTLVLYGTLYDDNNDSTKFTQYVTY